MSGAVHPFPQYSFMALCSVEAQGELYLQKRCFSPGGSYQFDLHKLCRTVSLLAFWVVQGDSKLLSVFPWPIIFKPETTK
jgi:hypothetical protein